MRLFRSTIVALATGAASGAQAQPIVVADSGDNAWMLVASLLVLIAALPGLTLYFGRGRGGQAGLAMFASAAIAALLFVILGYSLAFGEGTAILGGVGNLMLGNLADVQPDMTIAGSIYALFELVIALFTVGIVVASVAERTRIGWLLAFSGLWLLIAYVPIAHWIWGGGWLVGMGVLDYAGGIAVQVTAGVAALVIALLVGRDRGTDLIDDTRLTSAGAALLGIGWLAIIGGSGFGATGDTADAITNALLAMATATLAGLLFERFRNGAISATGAATAAISGLAAISAGADVVGPAGAILIGLVGAIGAAIATAIVRTFSLGSASTAFVANGGGATLGSLLLPIFVLPIFGGPGFDEGTSLGGQLATQGTAVVAVALWSAAATAIVALMVSMVLPITDKDEAGA
jgi:ammonium transporter, Amt family